MATNTDVSSEIDAALETAAVEETESSTVTEGNDASVTQTGEVSIPKGNNIPNARFREVNEAYKEYKEMFHTQSEEFKALQDQYREQTELVDAIRNLKFDPRTESAVELIDRALKGELEDEEASEEIQEALQSDDPSKGLEALQLRLERKVDIATEDLAERQAEMLLTAAQQQASSYLEELPDEYTDADKTIIGKLWTNEVDWDSIENDPSQLSSELVDSLQAVLDDYGVPRGALEAPQTDETTEFEPELTNEDMVQQLLDNDELGAFDEDGNPVLSDDDFAAQLAQSIKYNNS